MGRLAHILQHGILDVRLDMPSELVLIGGGEGEKKICVAANTSTPHPDLNSIYQNQNSQFRFFARLSTKLNTKAHQIPLFFATTALGWHDSCIFRRLAKKSQHHLALFSSFFDTLLMLSLKFFDSLYFSLT